MQAALASSRSTDDARWLINQQVAKAKQNLWKLGDEKLRKLNSGVYDLLCKLNGSQRSAGGTKRMNVCKRRLKGKCPHEAKD